MASRITGDIIESYLACRFKAHLKLAGIQGIRSDYEGFLHETRREVRQQAIGKILAKTPREDVASNIPLTAHSLRAGSSYVFDSILEDDLLSLSFDGLKRVDEPSGLGDFHYVPMLFHEGRAVGQIQKLLLGVMGLILSPIQEKLPAYGVTCHGQERRVTKVRFDPDTRHSQHLLRELKELANTGTPPSLILNKHCPVCEFRQRCHDQALQEDNLSLLRSMGEKEIKSYLRKGIFTITQLSYTFRPRRRPTWAKVVPRPHSFALQALALRENKIHINGSPNLKTSPLSIYLDIEGVPDEDLYYLIGVLIDDGRTQQADIRSGRIPKTSRVVLLPSLFNCSCSTLITRSTTLETMKTGL